MKFRPCIDIHNGKVKQIVGGSLKDAGNAAKDNFVSQQDGGFYANMYKNSGLFGGHIIILNPEGSQFYEEDVKQAQKALANFPQGMQAGGGINEKNALKFIDMGDSHVIVTSYVFKDGKINFSNLEKLANTVTPKKLVLDLSCRKKAGEYFIVTDRWQKFTNTPFNEKTLDMLCGYCDEFLVHAVDVEGKARGIEEDVVSLLGNWLKIPCTYAGGISSETDIEKIKLLGKGNVDFTVGSALDIFGGKLPYDKISQYKQQNLTFFK